jgi:FdhD protein
LLTEGIICRRQDILDIQSGKSNVVIVKLHPAINFDYGQLARHSFVSSSCGVCGKRSIAAVFALQKQILHSGQPRIHPTVIHGLALSTRNAQSNFRRTGGLHAAALFDPLGNLLSLYEDVGRHNAVDKLIGSQLLAGRIPIRSSILFLSGRAGFELIQKAVIAGIPIVAAVGAPSSLAVSLARQSSMTLIGFARDGRFNLYCDAGRLDLPFLDSRHRDAS